jgi:signal transduction histidine kinase
MADKKTFLFPLLLFAIFFVLIAFTGFFQIRIIRENIQGILYSEGEILSQNIQREIDRNMEYLELIDKSPSLITPVYLNLLSFDEAVAEDLYDELSKFSFEEFVRLPYKHVLLTDAQGNQLQRRGSITVGQSYMEALTKKGDRTVLKLPAQGDQTLLFGLRVKEHLLFVSLDKGELEDLREKNMVEAVLETEEKRLNVSGISVLDAKGSLYIGLKQKDERSYRVVKPLNTRYFPGYTLEIRMSSTLVSDTLRRTMISFVVLLLVLLSGGAAAIYLIFRLDRRHAERVKEMERDMELKERLVSLGKLASGMAHEIRNPLNAMSMSIQRLKREFVPEAEKRNEYFKFIDIVRGELNRVNQLVEEFLLSARSHAPMEKEKIHTILDEIAIILRERADSNGIRMDNKVDAEIVLECQKERLKQAFHNLILNAIEATGANGVITLSSELDSSHVRILIRDTGPGIQKENLSKVFEYYYTTKDKGMGLGLPISFTIIKDHGGDIHVTSEEGRGTTFTVTLPVKK